jgi:hypothetical protein
VRAVENVVGAQRAYGKDDSGTRGTAMKWKTSEGQSNYPGSSMARPSKKGSDRQAESSMDPWVRDVNIQGNTDPSGNLLINDDLYPDNYDSD